MDDDELVVILEEEEEAARELRQMFILRAASVTGQLRDELCATAATLQAVTEDLRKLRDSIESLP